ncbi:MAG: hypothetical protein HC915_06820 [Anaerolineae bacterium]|nr:hypothetical protein [Anaerolineae bacterium]
MLASAIANDKAMTKTVLAAHGLPVIAEYITVTRSAWSTRQAELLAQITEQVGYPAFVKPATLGSSIGVARVDDAEQATLHLNIALNLDSRVLVERAADRTSTIEINCAVLGQGEQVRASVLEQPTGYQDVLGFEEKYLRVPSKGMASQERIIPAPLEPDLAQRIQAVAVQAFQAIQGHGTARLDFLVQPANNLFWVNEINTLPGSLGFYLWEASGMTPAALCDELIRLARAAHAEKTRNIYNYRTELVRLAASRGSKGSKGSKSATTPPG